MFLFFVTMATKQWNHQQFCKSDIFKPNYLLTAHVYMNYAYSTLMTNTCLSNARNKITQNVSIFCNHGNLTMEPSTILQKITFSDQIISKQHTYI